ncbi:MAG: EF-P beta-lysylation protein EpmB, partial [Gammaproteobacteria bacterium]|nr:EF-P beta-lysylation protein EpmB [Gammaproteobacteria bacterium]
TRLPIVIPQRITKKILEKLKSSRPKIVLVTHCNHANELTQKTQDAFIKLREAGVLLLNQSVLLAGINDNTLTLAALSKKLFSQNILPYYLHMPDAVQGTQHFAVTERKALKIMSDLQNLLSGYLVPTLVREDPGAPSKTRI